MSDLAERLRADLALEWSPIGMGEEMGGETRSRRVQSIDDAEVALPRFRSSHLIDDLISRSSYLAIGLWGLVRDGLDERLMLWPEPGGVHLERDGTEGKLQLHGHFAMRDDRLAQFFSKQRSKINC